MATATEDTISDAEEGDDWTQPHMSAKINNNVDDDDGVVFEDDADENEGYLFAGQYEDTDEDIEIDGSQDESTATDVPDPYDKVYSNIPEETHMLKTVPNCGYCTAKKFEYETPGFCCCGGKICPGVFNPILHGKRLFQQFAVDTYIKIESSHLDYIRRNQDRLRADLYQGLVDSMLDGDIRAEKMPSSLRRLFATILVYCEHSDVAVLWQKQKDSMSEDYEHKSQNKTHVEQMVLIDIRNMLQSMGKDINTFPLPPIIDAYDDAIGTARGVYEEETIEPIAGDVALKDSLNKEQRAAYDKIMSVVDTDQGGLFFVDGPGGTGKTYLYRVLLATLCNQGGGTEDTNSDGDIHLPDDVCVPYSGSDSDLDNLIDFAFPNLNENMSDSTYITSRAILSTRNDWVDMINVKMIDRFQGEHMVYHSFDSAMDDPHNYYPPEFLNTLTPNGLPPHVLKLKIGCPVILLRNIDPANGLCNGTRLVVCGFQRNSIDAEIGQTIPNVGVYLPEPVFSHGQLYVVLSRATARSNIKILVIPAVDGRKKSRKGVKKNLAVDCGTYTKNIVYKEVLIN
eukprot:XP_020395285.1 uncharacterized protein LOC109940250 [Zea mays]